MTNHEQKTCPKCHSNFECKSNNIQNCQCETVNLSQQQRDCIATQFDECLCADCLKELRSQFNISQSKKIMRELILGRQSKSDSVF